MKEAHEVLQQKEAELAHVRKQIESLHIVATLLSNESPLKNPVDVLHQKEAGVVRVRHEIESLQIVAPLLSDDLPSEELSKKAASSAEETLDLGHNLQATGTDGMFSSLRSTSRRKLWKILKRG